MVPTARQYANVLHARRRWSRGTMAGAIEQTAPAGNLAGGVDAHTHRCLVAARQGPQVFHSAAVVQRKAMREVCGVTAVNRRPGALLLMSAA